MSTTQPISNRHRSPRLGGGAIMAWCIGGLERLETTKLAPAAYPAELRRGALRHDPSGSPEPMA